MVPGVALGLAMAQGWKRERPSELELAQGPVLALPAQELAKDATLRPTVVIQPLGVVPLPG